MRANLGIHVDEHLAHILGEILAAYLFTLKIIEDMMPLIKRYGLRSFRRKHRRRKARKRKDKYELQSSD